MKLIRVQRPQRTRLLLALLCGLGFAAYGGLLVGDSTGSRLLTVETFLGLVFFIAWAMFTLNWVTGKITDELEYLSTDWDADDDPPPDDDEPDDMPVGEEKPKDEPKPPLRLAA